MARFVPPGTVVFMTRSARAFTLIEAMLVVFLTGALLTVVVASYGGGRTAASDRATQASLDAVLDAAAAIAAVDGDLAAVTSVRLDAEVDDITVVDGAASDPDEVSVAVDGSGRLVGVAARSDDGACWFARTSLGGSVDDSGDRVAIALAADVASHPCTGSTALALPPADADGRGGSWSSPRQLS